MSFIVFFASTIMMSSLSSAQVPSMTQLQNLNFLTFSDQSLVQGRERVLTEAPLSADKRIDVSQIPRGAQISMSMARLEAQIYHSEAVKFEQFSVANLPLISTPGAFAFPFKAVLVNAHPREIEIDFEVLASSSLGHHLPMPALTYPCRCSQDQITFSDMHDVYYSQLLASQQQVDHHFYKIEYLGSFQGTPLSRIKIFPFWRERGENFIAHELKLTLTQAAPGDRKELMVGSEKLIESFFNDQKKAQDQYLILAAKRYHSQLASYVDFLTRDRGYQVKLVDPYQLVEKFHQEELSARSLKKALDQLYQDFPFQFALFVGDEYEIPTFYVETTFDPLTPSDRPYFTFAGEDDLIAEVFYGRIVLSSAADFESFYRRNKDYYFNGLGMIDQRSFVGIASDEGHGPSDRDYIEQMASALGKSFQDHLHFFHQGESNSNPQEVNKKLNRGVDWLNYIGHGLGPSWSSLNIFYDIDSLLGLVDQVRLPIVIDVACQNGRYSRDERLGVHFLAGLDRFGFDRGALAYYGGSVDITWHPPAVMAVGINQYVGEMIDQGLSFYLYQAIFAGHLYLFENHYSKDEVVENTKWYHLLGDPSLKL